MGIESYVNRIGGNSNVAEERFESLNIVNCNESLDSGNIISGDGELNWIFIVDVWICWNSAKETTHYKIIHKWRRDYIGDT